MTAIDPDLIVDDVSPAAIELAARLDADYGIDLRLRNNRLWVQPAAAYQQLSEADRALIREHRADLKSIVECMMLWLPRPHEHSTDVVEAEPEEPEPEVYAYSHRVTSRDVDEALQALGDEAVADYRAGRIPKVKAYGIARRRLRQLRELRAGPSVWSREM
jgi:hypothetical protein